MRIFLVAVFFVFFPVQESISAERLIVKTSAFSVDETLDRLTRMLSEKGITVFARIDHAAGAAGTGEKLAPTQVLIFGNPKLGTGLMQSNAQIGLDLPMKVLAYERRGKVRLVYSHPDALKAQYGIEGRDKVFAGMTRALDTLTSAAAAK